VEILDAATWTARRAAHEQRVDPWLAPHLARRRDGAAHPVEDFLFTYYSHRPGALRRWHPGFGVALEGGSEYAGLRGYETTRGLATVSHEHLESRRALLTEVRDLLAATASRPAQLGCLGMHEWAMVYGEDEVRHPAWPLRLGRAGTDRVVERHRIACSHFDAFRFFTAAARPLNVLSPRRDDRTAFEQPGCLHAGMDLYKHAYRLSPMVASELVADCFELARDIRVLDMRASPYDLTALGYSPVAIETVPGKQEYVDTQRGFAERGAPLRERLVAECDRLLAAGQLAGVRDVQRDSPPPLVGPEHHDPTLGERTL
jgi:hypothetical protein